MPYATRTALEADEIPNYLAVEIVTTRLDTGAAVTVRVTDARCLADTDGNLFDSRLRPDRVLDVSTGARTAPDPLSFQRPNRAGTGLSEKTSPNIFEFGIDNRRDALGSTFSELADYVMAGAQVIVSELPAWNIDGSPTTWADRTEIFEGWLQSTPSGGGDGPYRLRAVSGEGRRAGNRLSRRTYRGFGWGALLDNSAGAPAAAYLSRTASSALTPTAGAYSIGMIVNVVNAPSTTAVDGELWDIGGGKLRARLRTPDDLMVIHHSGTEAVFANAALVSQEQVVRVGIRYDGTTAYLYYNGQQVDSVAIAVAPSALSTADWIGRNAADTTAGDLIVHERWVDNTDIGDEEMRIRTAGPLFYDVQTQPGLWSLVKFLEGTGATAADLVDDSTAWAFGGTAAWSDQREGDDPQIGPGSVRGATKPHVMGHVTGMPAEVIEASTQRYEVSQVNLAIYRARVDGSPVQVTYSREDTYRLTNPTSSAGGGDPNSGLGTWLRAGETLGKIRDLELSKRVIARDDSISRPGSRIQHTGGAAGNNGVYTVGRVHAHGEIEITPSWPVPNVAEFCTLATPAATDLEGVVPGGDGTFTTPDPPGGSYGAGLRLECKSSDDNPTTEEAYIWGRNVRDRAEDTALDNGAFVTGGVQVTWVGDTGMQAQPFDFAIPAGQDPTYVDFLQALARTAFIWTTDGPRIDIGEAPIVSYISTARMGHWRTPSAGGTAISESEIVPGSLRPEASLPPAWRVVVLYRPSVAEPGNLVAGLTAGERRELTRGYLEVEVFRDEAIRTANDAAREYFLTVNYFDLAAALKVGAIAGTFFMTSHIWYSFRADVRHDLFEVGADLAVTHSRLPGGAVDMFAAAKRSNPTMRGMDVIGIS